MNTSALSTTHNGVVYYSGIPRRTDAWSKLVKAAASNTPDNGPVFLIKQEVLGGRFNAAIVPLGDLTTEQVERLMGFLCFQDTTPRDVASLLVAEMPLRYLHLVATSEVIFRERNKPDRKCSFGVREGEAYLMPHLWRDNFDVLPDAHLVFKLHDEKLKPAGI